MTTDEPPHLWNGSLGAVVSDTRKIVEWVKVYSFGMSPYDARGLYNVDCDVADVVGNSGLSSTTTGKKAT